MKKETQTLLRKLSHRLLLIAIALSPIYLIRFQYHFLVFNLLDALLFFSISARSFAIGGFHRFLSLARHSIRLNPSLFAGTGLLFLGMIFSFMNSPTLAGLGIIKSWFFLPFVSVFLWTLSSDNQEKKEMIWAVFMGSIIIAAISIGYYFGGYFTFDGRLKAFYLSPNHLAMILVPSFVLAWFFFFRGNLVQRSWKDKGNKVVSWEMILVSALMLFVLFATHSYGAWGAFFLSILIGEWLLLRKNSQKQFFVMGIIILCFIGFFLQQSGSEKMRGLMLNGERTSFASRLIIWRSSFHIGFDHWFLGIGPGNFEKKYLEYQKFYPPYLEWAVPQPHNVFLAFWLQAGLMGLVGFLTLLVGLIFRLKEYLNQKKDKGMLLTKIAFFAAIFCVTIHGFIDTPIWKNDLGLLWWVFVFLF